MVRPHHNKRWRLSAGFLVGACLIILGVVLQLSIGSIRWSAVGWPLNAVALAVLAVVVTAVALRSRIPAFRFLGTPAAAVPALSYAAALTVIMGLTRQRPDGQWLSDMLTFWPFVLVYTYVVVVLGVVVVRRLARLTGWRRDVPFLLNHLGLFIALTTGTLGHADLQRLQMWVTNNPDMANELSDTSLFSQYERFATDSQGRRTELPLAIELKRFVMDSYDDGTPRRYASEVMIYSKSTRHQYAATIDVNHPVEVDGWKIYQKDYRLTGAGEACQVSILELVSDPWQPFVYAGIYLMIAGAVLMFVFAQGRREKP